MSLTSRLRRLEATLGLDPYDAGANVVDVDRAWDRIASGHATLADFAVALGEHVEVLRAVLVARSRFLDGLDDLEVPTWQIGSMEAGAVLASVPPTAQPDVRIVEAATAWSHPPVATLVPAHTDLASPAGQLVYRPWVSACLTVVALGAPDGLPLRRAVAAGEFDDAEAVTRAHGYDEIAFAGFRAG